MRDNSEIEWRLPSALYARNSVRGSYSPMTCVVDVHPDLSASLEGLESGVYSRGELTAGAIDAQSTYLHETIHWWQHVGSTSGLALSLCYPAQAHLNHRHLLQLLADAAPIKSLRQFHREWHGKYSDQVDRSLNIILNNWHDIEHLRYLMLEPERADRFVNSTYFESVGHSYEITWSAMLWLLSSVGDPDLKRLPDPRTWESAFDDLRKRKVANFAYGEPIQLPEFGARALFEGQARFSQMQYLQGGMGLKDGWDTLRRNGMLGGIYTTAFEGMLGALKEPWPQSPRSPLVGLFLLLCDLAINPSAGFPLPLTSPELFVVDTDPGIRFIRLCQLVRDKRSALRSAIREFSAAEYNEITDELCADLGWPSPLLAAREVASWPERVPGFGKVMEENETFRFSEPNLPIRMFAARFIQFQRDKLRNPHFFTWPGFWMAPEAKHDGTKNDALELLDRHRALFLRTDNGEVRPALLTGIVESDLYASANAFFAWNAVYDLARQWQVEDGNFTYNFGSFSNQLSSKRIEGSATAIFERLFGVNPQAFNLL